MSPEFDDREVNDFLRRNRPVAPGPREGEFSRILLAAKSAAEPRKEAPLVLFRRLSFALAACLLIAIGAMLTVGGDNPRVAAGPDDERVESFLDDTINHAMTEQSKVVEREPTEEIMLVAYNGE
ncbi:MAG: hypothetical protein HY280_01080 [Nitrospinae bacterium]|nr:hypothetical protein [Nitrospinota bacterium]